MDSTLIIIISGIAGIAGGFIVAKMMEKSNVSNLVQNAKKEAAAILKDANLEGENIKKDKILQAKEKFIELKYKYSMINIYNQDEFEQFSYTDEIQDEFNFIYDEIETYLQNNKL